MFKDVLTHMQHATWYAQAGLIIFVIVFALISLKAILTPKREVSHWAELPLEDDRPL